MKTHARKSEYRRDLSLLVIDKFILGGVVLVIAFVIQTKHEEDLKKREIALNFSQVEADLIQSERSNLVKNMGIVLGIMQDSKPYGKFKDEESTDQFLTSKKSIHRSLLTILGLYPTVEKNSKEFLGQLDKTHGDMTRKRKNQEIKDDITAIQDQYKKLLDKVRDISIQAAKEDMNAVDKHFQREGWFQRLL